MPQPSLSRTRATCPNTARQHSLIEESLAESRAKSPFDSLEGPRALPSFLSRSVVSTLA